MTCDSLVQCLSNVAQSRAEEGGFEFWEGYGERRERLSFARLEQRARAIAARLGEVTRPGQRVLLFCPAGAGFITGFFGCLYARTIAVPVPVPLAVHRNVLAARLQGIVHDCEPDVVLGPLAALELLATSAGPDQPPSRALQRLAFEDVTDDAPARDLPLPKPEDVAFLQYTSGSTSRPKGVMLTHGNLMANVKMIRHALVGSIEQVRGVFWLPLFHDMGLIGGVLGNIYVGGTTVFMPPVDFVRRPITWLRAISETRANVSGAPDFGFQLAVERTTEEERDGLDLSSLEVAFSGAERIRSTTIQRFADAFAPHGLRRSALTGCYGLAEASLLVTAGPLTPEASAPRAASDILSSGRVAEGLDVLIVESNAPQRCEAGKEGEIWVRGPSVARGYWRDEVRSAATFGCRLPGSDADYLRTGDLGYLDGGELYVTGRMKDLVIVGGKNHHPEDLEETVRAAHVALRGGGCAAFSVEHLDQEDVIVFVEVDAAPEARAALQRELERAVRLTVAQRHQVHVRSVVTLGRGRIPRTSSGKIQRYLCREQYLAQQAEAARVVASAPAPDTTPRHA